VFAASRFQLPSLGKAVRTGRDAERMETSQDLKTDAGPPVKNYSPPVDRESGEGSGHVGKSFDPSEGRPSAQRGNF
jgi:hypothetical protein